ncbi:MAG: C39 family peptidase [Anaerolineae bacterium]
MRRFLIIATGILTVALITGASYWVAVWMVKPQRVAVPDGTAVSSRQVTPDSTASTAVAATDASTAAPTAVATAPATATVPASPTASATATTTATATARPTATATATPAFRQAAASADIQGIAHFWQTWNNCGPATLAMYLSHYGSSLTQEDVAAVLRPNGDDKNVRPDELVAYAQGQGYEAVARANGSAALLRLLLSNDVPVIVETWHEAEPGNGMGHYRLLTGYDDSLRQWIAYDSYEQAGLRAGDEYSGIAIPYDDFDTLWPVFNRLYVVVYPDDLAPLVRGILGDDADEEASWERAAAAAEAEVAMHDDDVYAWFNLGTDLVALGRYEEAAAAYERAQEIGWPKRMLWYQFSIFEAALQAGKPEWAVSLADSVMAQTSTIEEIWYWRGQGLAAQGRVAEARYAYEQAATLNPDYLPATEALADLSG